MKKTIYALGFFDGVHLGHQALLESGREMAAALGCFSGAVTFGTHPKMLTRGSFTGLINTPADRERLLLQLGGLDRVVMLPFDDHLRAMPWEDFLELLLERYGAGGFVCGDDFHFGYRGQGNARVLEQFCRERQLPFRKVEEQTVDGVRVSSTYIRELLLEGDVERANRFLGHPHVLTGTVVPGRQLGRRLGIPTANLAFPEGLAELRHGVYACRCLVGDRRYTAVTNIGTRPTVEGRGITVEPWLLDYSGDLYGKEISLEFHSFLRPEQKFTSLEALQTAIRADAEKARQLI